MAQKVELRPYPFPEGMDIPRLMPFQDYPWNGDGYLAAEVLRLKEAHGLKAAVETGTCLGSTTLWLWENFKHTRTVEIHRPYFDIAVQRVVGVVGEHMASDIGSSDVWFGGHGHEGQPNSGQLWFDKLGSANMISRLARNLKWSDEHGHRTLFFLDAHWGPNCPLLNELEAIANAGIKPCIIIHDFQVPGTDFGFDKMPDGRPFNMELIAAHLDRIYGDGKWKHSFPTQVEGARRGWVSIEPCS